MLRKPLIVYNEAKAKKVIQHLESNPAKGRCITSLTVTDYEDQQVMENLLQLAFTPSIERLNIEEVNTFSSYLRLDAIFKTIIEIAEESPIKFDRLKIIPDTFLFDDLYGKTLLTFKETLETVHLRLYNHDDTQDVLHRLEEFKKLEVLRLEEGELDSIQQLDAVLKGCHHLKKLYLNVEILDQIELRDLPASNAAMWEQLQVQKVPSLKTLVLASPGDPLAVEYLLYKYPNIEDFSLDTFAMLNPSFDCSFVNLNFERILNDVKRLKKYSLHFQMPPGSDLNRKCVAAKCDINSLTIQYPTRFIEDDEMNMHLDVDTLENNIRRAQFTVEIPRIASSFYHINLVRKAGIPLERIEFDFVNGAAVDGDWLYPQQLYGCEEAVVFFSTLHDFPDVKEIKSITHDLYKANDMFNTHDTIELRSLEVCGAEVTQDVLECVSYHCPHLKELKLVNCYLDPDDENTFYIQMKHTSFNHFVYTTMPVQNVIRNAEDRDAIDYFDIVQRDMLATWARPDIYLWLGIKEAGKKIYFQFSALSNEPLPVCQEVFNMRPVKDAPLIHFSCFNVKSITIHLGPVVSFSLSEDLIRKCLDSSFMSCPLEEDDMNYVEEEEEEEE